MRYKRNKSLSFTKRGKGIEITFERKGMMVVLPPFYCDRWRNRGEEETTHPLFFSTDVYVDGSLSLTDAITLES